MSVKEFYIENGELSKYVNCNDNKRNNGLKYN